MNKSLLNSGLNTIHTKHAIHMVHLEKLAGIYFTVAIVPLHLPGRLCPKQCAFPGHGKERETTAEPFEAFNAHVSPQIHS